LVINIGGVPIEPLQRFIRGDPIWHNLEIWEDLFCKDLCRVFSTKFSQSSSSSDKYSPKEKSFIVRFAESAIIQMGEKWRVPPDVQQNVFFFLFFHHYLVCP